PSRGSTAGSGRWPIGTASIAGGVFMAEVGRRLAALPGVQSSRTGSVLGFRQPDLASSCGAWISPVIFSAARIGPIELCAGASAIAFLGSEPDGCCAMRNFEQLASAARPNTASNEITTPAFRQERGLEPKYPNSGCTPGAKRIAIPLATILRAQAGQPAPSGGERMDLLVTG